MAFFLIFSINLIRVIDKKEKIKRGKCNKRKALSPFNTSLKRPSVGV